MTYYDIAARVTFGEIQGVSQANYTRSRGIQPGVIQLSVPGLPPIPTEIAPVRFTDGSRSFVVPDCILQSVDIDPTDGLQYVLSILDYRWKWKFGQISGAYNTVRGGVILPRTKKTPRELAEICFVAMGVRSYNVSALPNDTFPEVTWDLDNPAVALEDLCSSLGCVICPRLDGSVWICRQGFGAQLPFGKGGEIKNSVKRASIPDAINISADPTRWEISLELGEPVGLEKDGRVLPINQLSYAPKDAAGKPDWGNEDPKAFANVDKKYRELAMRSVWKWFRFKLPIDLPKLELPPGEKPASTQAAKPKSKDGKKEEPDNGQIVHSDQIAFGESCLVKEYLLGEDRSQERRKESFVYGRWYDRKDRGTNNVEKFSHEYKKNKKLIYDGGFQIDTDRALIKFSDAIFLYDDAETATARFIKPDVRLRTSIGYKNKNSDAQLREVFQVKTGKANGTQPMWVRRPDVRREIIVDPVTGRPIDDGGDNRSTVEKQLKAYAGYELAKLQSENPQQGEYGYFPLIELDGAIQQVTYTIDGSGFGTCTASRGTEHALEISSFEERRRIAKLNATLKQQAEIQNSKKDSDVKR